jgi:hypothetical protein
MIHLTQVANFNLQDLVVLGPYLPLDSSIFGFIFACLGVVTVSLPVVLFAGRAGKILDTAAKVVVILAGASNLHKNHGSGSGSSDDESDKEKDKEKDKDKDKDKDKTSEGTDTEDKNETKKNDSNSEGNTTSK